MPKKEEFMRSIVLDYLQSEEILTTHEAVKLLNVSESTVRRFFNKLEKSGGIIRVYGGIKLSEKENYYQFDYIKEQMKLEKDQIGKYAARLVADDDFIYIDCGTTTARMAYYLAERLKNNEISTITVVTNSLINLQLLHQYCTVILVSGTYYEERKSFAGPLSQSFLSQFHFTKSFTGVDGMTFEAGFMTSNIHVSQLSGRAASLSKQSYVLMDSSKVGQPSFIVYSTIEQTSALITDSKLPKNARDTFQKYAIELHIA